MITPENLTVLMIGLVPILGNMQFQVLEASPGKVRTRMPLEPNHNHLGSVYAGALASMAEASGGALLTTVLDLSRVKVMVQQLEIQYHRLALSDIYTELEIPEGFETTLEEVLASQGRAVYPLSIPVVDADGTVVASASLLYRFRLLA